MVWVNVYIILIMYVISLFYCYCWDFFVSFDNYSIYGFCFRGLIFLRLFFVWMDVKLLIISIISYLCFVVLVIKFLKDLKWDLDIVFIILFIVFRVGVWFIICLVLIFFWFIWLFLRYRVWLIWRGLYVWLR